MASVQMKVQMSGSRDGVDWPKPGETLDTTDGEAASLIASGIAVAPDEKPKAAKPKVEKAVAPDADVETR